MLRCLFVCQRAKHHLPWHPTQYLRWQVIDTPGVLDQPLERRNTIEMQAITALAHLRACILYVMDVSEQCGYSLKEQVRIGRCKFGRKDIPYLFRHDCWVSCTKSSCSVFVVIEQTIRRGFECEHSRLVSRQVALFKGIKALFANKPVLLVLNKIDVVRPEQLSPEDQEMLQNLARDEVCNCPSCREHSYRGWRNSRDSFASGPENSYFYVASKIVF
jgi:nucleolar GTP-binding protein